MYCVLKRLEKQAGIVDGPHQILPFSNKSLWNNVTYVGGGCGWVCAMFDRADILAVHFATHICKAGSANDRTEVPLPMCYLHVCIFEDFVFCHLQYEKVGTALYIILCMWETFSRWFCTIWLLNCSTIWIQVHLLV